MRPRAPAANGRARGREAAGVEALVLAGDVAREGPTDALSLVASYGPERALTEPAECVTELVAATLATRGNTP